MGTFVVPVYPVVGQPTRKQFAQVVIDDLVYLNGLAASSKGVGLINGSFEQNTGTNTAPSNWDLTTAAGNSCLIEVLAANVRHGKQSFKMTSPGGVVGGVGIVTADFYEIGEAQTILLSWFMKSTAAGIRNQVNVLYYDLAKTLISTVAAYDSVTNSITWIQNNVLLVAPAGSRFYKVQLLGVNNLVAGSVWFDGATCQVTAKHGFMVLTAPGAGTVSLVGIAGQVKTTMVGGGAGGSAYLSTHGGGGGGATQILIYPFLGSAPVSYYIGPGGLAGIANSGQGTDGGTTWFGDPANAAAGGSLLGPGGVSVTNATNLGADGGSRTPVADVPAGSASVGGKSQFSGYGGGIGTGGDKSQVLTSPGTVGKAGFILLEY